MTDQTRNEGPNEFLQEDIQNLFKYSSKKFGDRLNMFLSSQRIQGQNSELYYIMKNRLREENKKQKELRNQSDINDSTREQIELKKQEKQIEKKKINIKENLKRIRERRHSQNHTQIGCGRDTSPRIREEDELVSQTGKATQAEQLFHHTSTMSQDKKESNTKMVDEESLFTSNVAPSTEKIIPSQAHVEAIRKTKEIAKKYVEYRNETEKSLKSKTFSYPTFESWLSRQLHQHYQSNDSTRKFEEWKKNRNQQRSELQERDQSLDFEKQNVNQTTSSMNQSNMNNVPTERTRNKNGQNSPKTPTLGKISLPWDHVNIDDRTDSTQRYSLRSGVQIDSDFENIASNEWENEWDNKWDNQDKIRKSNVFQHDRIGNLDSNKFSQMVRHKKFWNDKEQIKYQHIDEPNDTFSHSEAISSSSSQDDYDEHEESEAEDNTDILKKRLDAHFHDFLQRKSLSMLDQFASSSNITKEMRSDLSSLKHFSSLYV